MLVEFMNLIVEYKSETKIGPKERSLMGSIVLYNVVMIASTFGGKTFADALAVWSSYAIEITV